MFKVTKDSKQISVKFLFLEGRLFYQNNKELNVCCSFGRAGYQHKKVLTLLTM